MSIFQQTRPLYQYAEGLVNENMNIHIADWYLDPKKSIDSNGKIPTLGLSAGNLKGEKMTTQRVDAESELYGINKIQAKYCVDMRRNEYTSPRRRPIQTMDFFERPSLFMPEPLVMENTLRPNIP